MSSVVIAKEAVPDTGRMNPKGTISAGKPKQLKSGVMNCIKASKAPELRKTVIATNIPNKNGKREMASVTPSLPPSTNSSYAGNFCHMAAVKTTKINKGMIVKLIDVITFTVIPSRHFYNRRNDLIEVLK